MRRSTGPWTPAVHALLRHLEDAGFDGAPRLLGTDEQGREVLSFVHGEVPERADPEIVTETVLRKVGRLLRRYHDAVRDFELPPGIEWHQPSLPGERTVVCHNDISPRNTVFLGGWPVAFLDWDLLRHLRPGMLRRQPGSSFPSPTLLAVRATAGPRLRTAPSACA